MKNIFLSAGFLLLSSVAFAQPQNATPTSRFQWAMPIADVNAGLITRFELKIDDGPFAAIGMATNDGGSGANILFSHPIPALTVGNHTAIVRACNVSGCGPESAPLTFVLVILPSAPQNFRIFVTP